MKTEFIKNFLSGQRIEPEQFLSHINFDYISGSFVKNNIYKDINQFGETQSGYYIISQYSPAVFMSCYKYPDISGSGLFDGSNALKIKIDNILNNKCLMLNYINNIEDYSFSPSKGKGKTLLDISSSEDSQDKFSYSVYLTDRNDIFINFSGVSSGIFEKYNGFMHDNFPSGNVLSLNLKNNKIILYQYDICANTFREHTVELVNSYTKIPLDIYVGNKVKYKNIFSTGFSGIMKDIVLINQNLDEDQLLNLSKISIQTGEIYTSTSKNQNPYILYYSGVVNPNAIIGSGITGYTQVTSELINLKCEFGDKNCEVYTVSGLTGIITGSKIEYQIGQQYQDTLLADKIIPIYDLDRASDYSSYNIKNLLPNPNSVFEIQTYNYDLDLELISGYQINYLPSSLKNIFYNGKITRDFITGSNSVTIINPTVSGNIALLINNNYNIYISGYNINQNIVDNNINLSNIDKFNIFLDGLKIIENKDYFRSGNYLYFNNNIINKDLIISEDIYNFRMTGKVDALEYLPKIYPNRHLIWIDGILKYEGLDYGSPKHYLNGGFFNNVTPSNIKILSR
ncbi:hypothetical protein EBU95_07555 [bacterium]|nr:hypothetical protein [bacterium]